MAKITNKLGLPEQMVKVVDTEYNYKPMRYSITSLLQPEREMILKRRYNDVVEQDVSEMIWMMFGTGFHKTFEEIPLDDGQHAEKKMEYTLPSGYTLSGIVDYIDSNKGIVDDYKTASVWSIIYESNHEKWKKQLQLSAYLWWRETGQEITKGRILAFLKDWNKRKSLEDENYPALPVVVIEFNLGTPQFNEIWLLEKFKTVAELEQMEDAELPMCTPEERFNNGDKWAVKKKKLKRATKVHDTFEDAVQHLENLEKGYAGQYEIELRKGEDKKCHDYCSVNKFCPYYQNTYLNIDTDRCVYGKEEE